MTSMGREAWTDERMDDLKGSVDSGFHENREEFRALRGETRSEFQAVRSDMKSEFHAVRSEMKSEFHAVRSEMAQLRGEMAQQFAAQNRLMVIGFLGVIATILTQV